MSLEPKMKLAFIAPGSVGHTTKWVNSLAEQGLSVTLITQHQVTSPLHSSIDVIYLPYKGGKGYFLNALALNRTIKKLKPDVINVHYASGYGTLAVLSRIKPYILSVWGSDVYEFPYQSKIKLWLTQIVLKNAKKIASTSEAMAEQVKKVLNRIEDNIAITPFGVDLSLFYKQRAIFSQDVVSIGIVKTLEHKYGLDLLIKAFAQAQHILKEQGFNQPLSLTIVGTGPLLEELKSLTHKLAIDSQVNFVGRVNNSKVTQYINNIDIFVVPSRIESFGVAAVEALACERPCIVTNVGGLPGVVLHNQTGLVVEEESFDAIAKAIVYLVNNPCLAAEMGRLGRADVLAKYDEPFTVQNMISLYQSFNDEHAH